MAEDKSYVIITEDKPLPNGAVRELMIPLLAAGQEFRFRARGASMSPFIRDGDVLTVSPLAIGEPRVADVVAVFDAEKAELIIHRVIDRRRSSWLIRGDNTDGTGLVRDLTINHGFLISGSRILLLGAGGASRGVVRPLLERGPEQLTIANRTALKAEELASSLEGLGSVDGCGPMACHPATLDRTAQVLGTRGNLRRAHL